MASGGCPMVKHGRVACMGQVPGFLSIELADFVHWRAKGQGVEGSIKIGGRGVH